MISMTPRERILRAFNRQEVDRPPVCPLLTRWVRGRRGSPSELHQLYAAEEFGLDPLICYGSYINHPNASDYVYRPGSDADYRDLPDVNVEVRVENQKERTVHVRRFETPDGVLSDRIVWARSNMTFGDGPNPHREEPLVKSIDDLPALRHLYPPPRPDFADSLRMFAEIVGQRALLECGDWTNAGCWGMESLGPEQMLVSALTDKELLRGVLRVCQEVHLRNLKTVLESGQKYILGGWSQCGPSVGWSPTHISEFFLPLIREVVELVHGYDATYRFQDDGKMAGIIPQLVEMNVDVIGALQPPPLGDCVFGELKRQYGDRVCLFGGLDPIYTFELGNPEKVRDAVKELLEQAGDGRGVVISAAEAFGPATPGECIRELGKTVREHTDKVIQSK